MDSLVEERNLECPVRGEWQWSHVWYDFERFADLPGVCDMDRKIGAMAVYGGGGLDIAAISCVAKKGVLCG